MMGWFLWTFDSWTTFWQTNRSNAENVPKNQQIIKNHRFRREKKKKRHPHRTSRASMPSAPPSWSLSIWPVELLRSWFPGSTLELKMKSLTKKSNRKSCALLTVFTMILLCFFSMTCHFCSFISRLFLCVPSKNDWRIILCNFQVASEELGAEFVASPGQTDGPLVPFANEFFWSLGVHQGMFLIFVGVH